MILKNFIKNYVTSPVFKLEQCSLHINGVELEQDCTGDQIPLIVVGIPTPVGTLNIYQSFKISTPFICKEHCSNSKTDKVSAF